MTTAQVFSTTRLFDGLPYSEVNQLLYTLRSRTIVQGQYIFNTGQEATCLYLLQDGLVKVSYTTPDGEARILKICESGDIFGELFLGAYRLRIGQAQAMTDCTLYGLGEEDLKFIMQRYPQISLNFMRHLVDSQRHTLARMHVLQRADAKSRLLGTLLHLSRTMCCQGGSYFTLNPSISQQDIADMTGLNRSTVSSLINRLREEGILGGTGRYLTIDVELIADALWDEGFELLE
ncbi:MAG: Crp/Fnr family transcriptional regulator [Anaerolineae bacterium]|nr:Crp/Fnr family transcriptional regulator [Anaerolineae bacterium]MDQ7036130.1 Crp/Fnr family transcriptional regulator [Anaerolineae bacterium]